LAAAYRFNDGLGDLQLNVFYEWLRREVPVVAALIVAPLIVSLQHREEQTW